MNENEKRIRALTKLYYSNPKIKEAIMKFAKDREVIPRYFEVFGKRPDTLNYPSDIDGLVNKGATSFHASEELWEDPFKINSEMNVEEMNTLRKGWNLLIDIDSQYLDYSKIAAKLIIATLENHGIKNYGLKFSGNKGFHIIVSWKAFPEEFNGEKTKDKFPEWPRIIVEYLINKIRPDYNREISKSELNIEALQTRTGLSEKELIEVICPNCNRPAKKGDLVTFKCPVCRTEIKRKDPLITKRKLRCINDNCAGILEIIDTKNYYHCQYCNISNIDKAESVANKKIIYSNEAKKAEDFSSSFEEGISGHTLGSLDLVLVAPRHLFRMPYSLHEKTALASVVLAIDQLEKFSPKDANPLNVKIKDYLPENEVGEATNLLTSALEWKKTQNVIEEKLETKYKDRKYEKLDIKGVPENLFPQPIKKLLLGLKDGKKRGLFILITFLKYLNFPAEYIVNQVKEWNKLNEHQLKEGYIKSQLDWHFKQKKTILPPNYSNDAFYKDLGLLDKKPDSKNPISEVIRKLKKHQRPSN